MKIILKKLNRVLNYLLLSLIFTTSQWGCSHEPSIPAIQTNPDPLKRLLEGNERFVLNKLRHPDESPERRAEIAKGQHPFAIIVSCSDSRVPPEIIFNEGLGDLFTIRTAGNLIDSLELGSIEYAVEHLGVKLVMVLGHEDCGAIQAFLHGGESIGHIKKIIEDLKEEEEEKIALNSEGNKLDNCVLANINHVVKKIKASEPILSEETLKKELMVVGARYDLNTGEVTIIPEK